MKSRIAILVLLVGFLVLGRQFILPEKRPIACPDCNLVFISFDDLRADHVSALGYQKKTTPTIDQFAQEGFNFTNAFSVTSWTLPSSMSWFTGLYPSNHKVLNKFTINQSGQEEITTLEKVSPNTQTLAQELGENGYRTGAFTGGAGLNRQFGFDLGFEVYTDEKDFAGFEETVPKALKWIKEHQSEKFFVFLHGYDIHGQFFPPDGYDRRFVDFDYQGKLTGSAEEQKQLREDALAQGKLFLTKEDVRFLTALYDEKIQRADERFAQFIKEYQDLGLMGKTIFILTSDHGEELYEHGRIDHGHSLYEELVHVPLIILTPEGKGRKIDTQVKSLDLAPTILDLLKIKPDVSFGQQMTGTSLVPLIEGREEPRDVFLETDYRYTTSLRGVRTVQGWKLIVNPKTGLGELYNLRTDPEEKQNLIDREKKQAAELDEKLNLWLKKQRI